MPCLIEENLKKQVQSSIPVAQKTKNTHFINGITDPGFKFRSSRQSLGFLYFIKMRYDGKSRCRRQLDTCNYEP